MTRGRRHNNKLKLHAETNVIQPHRSHLFRELFDDLLELRGGAKIRGSGGSVSSSYVGAWCTALAGLIGDRLHKYLDRGESCTLHSISLRIHSWFQKFPMHIKSQTTHTRRIHDDGDQIDPNNLVGWHMDHIAGNAFTEFSVLYL